MASKTDMCYTFDKGSGSSGIFDMDSDTLSSSTGNTDSSDGKSIYIAPPCCYNIFTNHVPPHR